MILVIDADASKVIDAVRATGVVITRPMIEYAHYIIKNMKAIGTWDLCNAVYGIVGGTANSHAINWKSIGTYNLTYGGTVTHSSNGMQGNGTTGYADTNLVPSSVLILNNTHISIYSRTDSDGVFCDIGAGSIGAFPNAMTIYTKLSNQLYSYSYQYSANARIIVNNSDSKGYYISNRALSTSFNVFKNGNILGLINSSAGGLPTNSLLIGAYNEIGFAIQYSNRQYSFSTIGSGFTDTQAQLQSQIVTNAQLILNRA